jgi:autotransporter-associated beta strand protein
MGQYVWAGTASGSFSNAANWQGGVAPASNNPATALTFNAGNSGAITATNDIGSPFQVNKLTFNSFANPAFTVSGTSGYLFQLTGSNPTITLSGNNVANNVMSSTGSTVQLAANTTINGSGMGGLTFNGISDDGNARTLTVSGTPATQNSRVVVFASNNTFTGGVTLNGGTVGVNTSVNGAFGTASSVFRVQSPSVLQVIGSATPTVGTYQLDSMLRLIATGTLTTGATTLMQGSGALLLNPTSGNGLTINTPNTTNYTGQVTVDRFDLPNFDSPFSGGVTLSFGGVLPGVTQYNIRSGGSLVASNQGATAAINDRISNAATINLASGQLRVLGVSTTSTAPANVTEVVGTVSGSGMSVISAEPTTGTTFSTVTNINTALTRVDRGGFLFRGLSLGSGTLAVGATNGDGSLNFSGANATGYVVVPTATSTDLKGGGGAAGSQTISILPYAVGDTTNSLFAASFGASLVTLDPVKNSGNVTVALNVRLLDTTTEYAGTLAGIGDNADNVRLTAGEANNAVPLTMNSLVLASNGASDGSVSGTGTLRITSGALLDVHSNSPSVTITNSIDFGHAEATICTPGNNHTSSATTLIISGNLIGDGGLTKAGLPGGTNNTTANTLVLTGDNHNMSGPLTVDSGVLNFNSASALPGTGTIVTNGSPGTSLSYSGTTPLTLGRAVAANSGWLTFRALDTAAGPNNGSLSLDQPISGAAGVGLVGVQSGADIWVTGTSNSYTGPTALGGGNVHIAGDGSLGNGGGVEFDGSSLILEGDWTTSRHLNFITTSTINTNGHNATLSGPMTSFLGNSLNNTPTGGFTKNGLGTLAIAGTSSTLTGPVTVNAGALIVNGSIGASTANAVVVNSSATLGGGGAIYRPVIINIGATLSPGNSTGTISTWNLTLSGNLNAEVNGTSAADLVNVNGTVSLGAASVLNLSVTGAPSGPVIIVQNDGTDAVSGTFATVNGLPPGATINYAFGGTDSLGRVGDGNDIAVIFPAPCYANCDGSTVAPILNVGDFTCFLQKFAASDPYANCDHSTQPPVLNVADFTCFLQKYAAGCN